MERQIPLIEAPLERLDAFLDTVPRHRRVRGVRAVQAARKASPRHRERRHGLPHQAHLEQARPAPCPRGRQPHGLQGRGLPPRIPLRTRGLRFRGVQVRRCRGRLGDGKTLLIGDGLSDCCLARSASFTLARQGKALHRRCAAEGYPYFTYLDFFDILEAFWRTCRSPSPPPAAAPLPRAESFAFGTNPIFEGDLFEPASLPSPKISGPFHISPPTCGECLEDHESRRKGALEAESRYCSYGDTVHYLEPAKLFAGCKRLVPVRLRRTSPISTSRCGPPSTSAMPTRA